MPSVCLSTSTNQFFTVEEAVDGARIWDGRGPGLRVAGGDEVGTVGVVGLIADVVGIWDGIIARGVGVPSSAGKESEFMFAIARRMAMRSRTSERAGTGSDPSSSCSRPSLSRCRSGSESATESFESIEALERLCLSDRS